MCRCSPVCAGVPHCAGVFLNIGGCSILYPCTLGNTPTHWGIPLSLGNTPTHRGTPRHTGARPCTLGNICTHCGTPRTVNTTLAHCVASPTVENYSKQWVILVHSWEHQCTVGNTYAQWGTRHTVCQNAQCSGRFVRGPGVWGSRCVGSPGV